MKPTGADPGSDIEYRAGRGATGMLWAATLVLPRGVSRDRYRREFAAELYGRPRLRQVADALGICRHMWSLRWVLVHGTAVCRLPLLCRTSVHHHWERHANNEGVPFHTCSRCGQERESPLANSVLRPMHVGGMDY